MASVFGKLGKKYNALFENTFGEYLIKEKCHIKNYLKFIWLSGLFLFIDYQTIV